MPLPPIIIAGALGVMGFRYVQKRLQADQSASTGTESGLKAQPDILSGAVPNSARPEPNALQEFTANRLLPLLKDIINPALEDVSLDEDDVENAEQQATQAVVASSALLGSTVLSALIYPPLLLLHIPVLLFLSIPMCAEAYRDLIHNRKVTATTIDALIFLGSLAYGVGRPTVIPVAALATWLHAFTTRLILKTRHRTRHNLTNLMDQQPDHVWIVVGGAEVEVDFESIQAGDVVVVEAGHVVSIDGIITEGVAGIDEHLLTGEQIPVEKSVGDRVFASSLLLAGKIHVCAQQTGEETVASQISAILSHTSDYISSVQLRGTQMADRLALPTLLLSGLALPTVGASQSMAILFAGVGYNMKMLGPLSVLTFLQRASLQGILIKDGRALEQVSGVDTVVFDKTGTLTLEQFQVRALHTENGCSETDLLTSVAAAEQRQVHPIAVAILEAAAERQLSIPEISDAALELGYGIQTTLNGNRVQVGSERFMKMEAIAIPEAIEEIGHIAHDRGHTIIYAAINGRLAGAIELQPTVRPEAKQVVDHLLARGLDLYVLSGDHARPTQRLAETLGIEHVFAEVLPEEKASLISKLQNEGRSICFVGDGINDAIGLKKANVSVSLNGATTVATDSAQIILMDETLKQLPALFTLAQEFESNMRVNLLTTVVPGTVIIGGALLGTVGMIGSIGIFFAGMGVGIINAMLPLRHEADQDGNEEPAADTPRLTSDEAG